MQATRRTGGSGLTFSTCPRSPGLCLLIPSHSSLFATHVSILCSENAFLRYCAATGRPSKPKRVDNHLRDVFRRLSLPVSVYKYLVTQQTLEEVWILDLLRPEPSAFDCSPPSSPPPRTSSSSRTTPGHGVILYRRRASSESLRAHRTKEDQMEMGARLLYVGASIATAPNE